MNWMTSGRSRMGGRGAGKKGQSRHQHEKRLNAHTKLRPSASTGTQNNTAIHSTGVTTSSGATLASTTTAASMMRPDDVTSTTSHIRGVGESPYDLLYVSSSDNKERAGGASTRRQPPSNIANSSYQNIGSSDINDKSSRREKDLLDTLDFSSEVENDKAPAENDLLFFNEGHQCFQDGSNIPHTISQHPQPQTVQDTYQTKNRGSNSNKCDNDNNEDGVSWTEVVAEQLIRLLLILLTADQHTQTQPQQQQNRRLHVFTFICSDLQIPDQQVRRMLGVGLDTAEQQQWYPEQSKRYLAAFLRSPPSMLPTNTDTDTVDMTKKVLLTLYRALTHCGDLTHEATILLYETIRFVESREKLLPQVLASRGQAHHQQHQQEGTMRAGTAQSQRSNTTVRSSYGPELAADNIESAEEYADYEGGARTYIDDWSLFEHSSTTARDKESISWGGGGGVVDEMASDEDRSHYVTDSTRKRTRALSPGSNNNLSPITHRQPPQQHQTLPIRPSPQDYATMNDSTNRTAVDNDHLMSMSAHDFL